MNNPIKNLTTRASLAGTAVHNSRWFASLLAGTAVLGIPVADAADIQWTGTTGSYNNPSDWSTGTIPGPIDFAWVGNGGTVLIGPGDPQWTTQDFRTGAGGLEGHMEQSGSIANVTSWFRLAVDDGSVGTYTMSGGLLNVRTNRFNVGERGEGILNITGGLIYHGSGDLRVGNRAAENEASALSTGVVNQSGGTFTNESQVWIGYGTGGDNTTFGTLNVTGGTFNVRRWFIIGRTGGEGELNISGADTLVAKSGEDGHFIMGDQAGGDGPTGVVNHDSGTVMVGSESWIGQSATSTGIYNLNGGSIFANNWFSVGRNSGTGTLNMSGGTITKTGGGGISIAGGGGTSNGTVNHTGGLFHVVDGEVYVGENGSGVGVYNLSDSAELIAGNVVVSRNDTTQGTLNLDGGTLRAARIFKNSTNVAASGTVNFNGTQIIGRSHQPNFIASLTNAVLESGGLLLDTDTYVLGTPQIFTGEGGFVKTGLGTFSIDTDFDATGTSTVSRGVLALTGGTFGAGALTVTDGATLFADNAFVAADVEVAASGGALLHDTASSFAPVFEGDLTLSGPTRIDFADAVVAPGTYTVAEYDGALNGGGNLSLGRPGSVDLTTPGEINVTVGAARALTWTGSANSTWDIFSTANWDNLGSPAAFGQGDSVVLEDAAGTSSPISVTGPVRPAALTFNNSDGNTITLEAGNSAAEVTGLVPVVKSGAGKVILDLDATLATGSTVAITGGELQVGNGGTAGSLGLASIDNAGILHINLDRDRVFTNAITGSGSGSFVKSGDGNVTLTAAFGNPGTTTVNGGRLTLVTPAILTGTATTIADGAELEIRSTANHDGYTGTLGGSGTLIKTGGSELFLNADNSAFTGDIEIRRGPTNSLNIRHVNGLGSPEGKTVVHGLNGTNSQQLNIRNLGAGGPFNIAEPIELRANAFGRAGITHEAGGDSTQTINLTGPIAMYSSARTAVNLLRNFNRTGTVNFLGDITGEMGGATFFLRGNTNASTGSINILGDLNIADNAELVVTEDVRVRIGGAGKTYANFRTIIANGHLRTLVDNALPPEQPLFLGEGNNGVSSKLILGEGTTSVVQTVTGIGSNNTNTECRIVGGAGSNSTLTLNLMGNANYPSPFGGAGTNENNLTLVKANIGTLTLGGNSTHTGTTTVTGGTLLLNGTFTTSPIQVDGGGTLGGAGFAANVTAAGTPGSVARIAPGNNGVGTLTVAGGLTLGGNSGIDWQITDWTGTPGGGFDRASVSGALTISATPANPVVVRINDINLPLDNFTESAGSFDIVTAAGGITGFDEDAFVIDATGFVSGAGTWSISQDGTALRLTYTIPVAGAYDTWAASFGLDPNGNGAAGVDADNNGQLNGTEFALGGSPVDGADNAKIYSLVDDTDADTQDELLMTIAVRDGGDGAGGDPVFSAGGSPSATVDGFTITVEGSATLDGFPVGATEVAPVTTGLPAAPAGYEYRTFSLDGSNGLPNRGFLRVDVTEAP